MEAVLSALALCPTAWPDWSTTLARVKFTQTIEMDTVQNANSCNRYRIEVWMLILAILMLLLILWRFVQWIASLLRLSDAVSWRISHKNVPVWCRSEDAHFSRNFRACSGFSESQNQRFRQLLRVLCTSTRSWCQQKQQRKGGATIYQYLSSNASWSSRANLSHETATRTKSFSDAS